MSHVVSFPFVCKILVIRKTIVFYIRVAATKNVTAIILSFITQKIADRFSLRSIGSFIRISHSHKSN